jgi:AbrB family looped-hinge helix DNA binding protein
MPRVSSKRQITLPVSQCEVLGISPGDEVETFVADGRLTIVKKAKGAAAGLLRHVQGNPDVTDEESRQSALQ